MDARADLTLREARAEDLPAITAIYGHHVRTGLASFETEAPDLAEMTSRYEAVRAKGFPYLVAEVGGQVAGYAYASHYRPRFAYRFTVEDSVYIHPERTGLGLGRALLVRLLEECERAGCRQVIAVIGDSGNAASIALHRACGFEMTGTFRSIGYKHGRWLDTVLMQRTLGEGDKTPP
jgi:phosphinothricin acetyltransferase